MKRRNRDLGTPRRRVLASSMALVVACAASLLPVVPATAQDAGSPERVIRARNDAVKQILDAVGDSVDDATRERLKGVINGLMDFRELSRRALGRHWRERTPEEQADFVKVFRELVRNSSVRKLGIYRADSVVYRPAEIDGDRSRVVTLAYKDDKDVEIVYEMHRVGGEWKAWDVVIDGSSTMRTYRDSFNREIAKTSYEAMYRRLVDKLEQERASGT